MNMARPPAAPDLDPYRAALHRWLPKADVRAAGRALPRFDALVTHKGPTGRTRYLVEVKRHLRHQDIGVVIDQLNHYRKALPPEQKGAKVLLLAPHIRAQQATALERAGIDYMDLAGNAHLQAMDLFVHVEGRQPPREPLRAPGRPQKGWIKTVMALLIQPDLANATYRALADRADVALGTVAACINDLTARGLLLEAKDARRVTDRPALVALWVQAYVEGLRPKLKERRFQVRADHKQAIWKRLQDVLGNGHQAWALTGADAAERRNQFFHAEDTEVYAPARILEDRETQRALVAQPAIRGGNLVVIEPPGPAALPEMPKNGVPVAPALLAYAELRYRGTERAIEAAELILPEVLQDAAR